MGIKKQELIDGCFARAADDEPLFVLRAQDMTAPRLVRQWAEAFRAHHTTLLAKVLDPTLRTGLCQWDNETSKAKYEGAIEVAEQMEAWRGRKIPD